MIDINYRMFAASVLTGCVILGCGAVTCILHGGYTTNGLFLMAGGPMVILAGTYASVVFKKGELHVS